MSAVANATSGSQTITPTAEYYQMSPSTVTTVTLGTGVEGQTVLFHNLVATNVVLIDTGATIGGGNITLGVDDVASFIYGGAAWVMQYTANNS